MPAVAGTLPLLGKATSRRTVVMLVRSSVLLPLSSAVSRSGVPGAGMLVRLSVAVRLFVAKLPAASVALAVNCLLVAEPMLVQSVLVRA